MVTRNVGMIVDRFLQNSHGIGGTASVGIRSAQSLENGVIVRVCRQRFFKAGDKVFRLSGDKPKESGGRRSCTDGKIAPDKDIAALGFVNCLSHPAELTSLVTGDLVKKRFQMKRSMENTILKRVCGGKLREIEFAIWCGRKNWSKSFGELNCRVVGNVLEGSQG